MIQSLRLTQQKRDGARTLTRTFFRNVPHPAVASKGPPLKPGKRVVGATAGPGCQTGGNDEKDYCCFIGGSAHDVDGRMLATSRGPDGQRKNSLRRAGADYRAATQRRGRPETADERAGQPYTFRCPC